ncbi:hypothetical protein ACLQ2Q_21640 [Microbacterium sp. DT81.1]|uniref:hypothetical protein n=1 Tax=Microbacterium sp. DT81.1 TaxID=3393413 RepID=UPI003CEA02C8
MERRPPPSDAERELNELRARAYGPDPDIGSDPAALARLVELEAAHVADRAPRPRREFRAPPAADASQTAPPVTADPAAHQVVPPGVSMDEAPTVTSSINSWRSLWRRATVTRSRRISFIAAIVVGALLGYAVTEVLGPHPDETLHPTATAAKDRVIQLMAAIGVDGDLSTLRGFEHYRDVEPWSVVDAEGRRCLMALDLGRTTGPPSPEGWPRGILNAQCVPPGTELFVDLGVWPAFNDAYTEGLPDGTIIRFRLREDAVHVFLYPAPEAD